MHDDFKNTDGGIKHSSSLDKGSGSKRTHEPPHNGSATAHFYQATATLPRCEEQHHILLPYILLSNANDFFKTMNITLRFSQKACALLLLCALVGTVLGFGVRPMCARCSTTAVLSATRRKKESFAEKRARRQARQQREITLPKRSQKVILIEQEAAAATAGEASQLQSSANDETPKESMTLAQELIQRQRRSVAMLTLVKESIDKISSDQITKDLAEQGYVVIDDFLGDEETLSELQQESIAMLDKGMTPELGNLQGGEFVGLVRGGEEQYNICPRAIEFVVATTKHFGSVVVPDMKLSDSNCLGRMRTFDRQIQVAKDALAEQEGSNNDDQAEEEEAAPFARVVDGSDAQDQRRLSLRYYLVPSEWDFGGGIEFESGTVIKAKRDRLVLWKSSETALRGQPWRGDESHRFGSCLELDLIQTLQQE